MPMTLISRTTLTTTAASVTFNSIPQTFQTLKLVISVRNTGSAYYTSLNITVNGNSMSGRRLGYEAGAAYSDTNTGAYQDSGLATTNTFASIEYTIPNYASASNKATSYDSVSEDNSANNAGGAFAAGLVSNTAAVSMLTLSSNFAANSTFSLYGVS